MPLSVWKVLPHKEHEKPGAGEGVAGGGDEVCGVGSGGLWRFGEG